MFKNLLHFCRKLLQELNFYLNCHFINTILTLAKELFTQRYPSNSCLISWLTGIPENDFRIAPVLSVLASNEIFLNKNLSCRANNGAETGHVFGKWEFWLFTLVLTMASIRQHTFRIWVCSNWPTHGSSCNYFFGLVLAPLLSLTIKFIRYTGWDAKKYTKKEKEKMRQNKK